MSMIIQKIPDMSDQDLLNLFHNAAKSLTKRPNLEAASVIKAIGNEWTKRLDRARAGTRSTERPNDGMLATLGYRVGSVNGEKTPIRRKILELILEQLHLPIVDFARLHRRVGGATFVKTIQQAYSIFGKPTHQPIKYQ
jgi:hypothetical protein